MEASSRYGVGNFSPEIVGIISPETTLAGAGVDLFQHLGRGASNTSDVDMLSHVGSAASAPWGDRTSAGLDSTARCEKALRMQANVHTPHPGPLGPGDRFSITIDFTEPLAGSAISMEGMMQIASGADARGLRAAFSLNNANVLDDRKSVELWGIVPECAPGTYSFVRLDVIMDGAVKSYMQADLPSGVDVEVKSGDVRFPSISSITPTTPST
jgi:hypothetical protein